MRRTEDKRNVQSVKNSLKFKAQEKTGVLSVKVGVKKFSVPVKARMLSGGDYLFLSFPASSELYRVDKKQLSPMAKEDDASEAYGVLTPARKRGRRRASGVEMPSALEDALKSLPSGYRLGYGSDGAPKLVKTRGRRSKKA